MRLLLVEDERRLANALAQLFKENRYLVDIANDGEAGLDLALTGSYDAVILDVMLPVKSGIDIVREVRAAGLDVPVLLLTARDTVDDRVTGLDAGADDYLVKPFANKELLARIRALTRRGSVVQNSDELQVGPLAMDLQRRMVKLKDEPLNLTVKEYQLLELLMRNVNKVMSKEVILDRVWGPDASVIGNAVENYVHFLRKKIDAATCGSSLIETVRGVGYVIRAAESEDA